jgi:hypothetical protein
MISRSLAELDVVIAFDQKTFHSCTVSGFVCSCGSVDTGGALPNSYAGYIIDRLGLSRQYQAVLLGVYGSGSRQSSAGTCTADYLGVSVGLQHSSSTCSGGFTDYSTGNWQTEQPFVWVTTATSTAASPFFSNEQSLLTVITQVPAATVMSTAASTTTSTGYAQLVSCPATALPLDGAKRFIRMIVAPHIETTGCAGSFAVIGGSLVFGAAEEAPSPFTIRGRVHVTSACTT